MTLEQLALVIPSSSQVIEIVRPTVSVQASRLSSLNDTILDKLNIRQCKVMLVRSYIENDVSVLRILIS